MSRVRTGQDRVGSARAARSLRRVPRAASSLAAVEITRVLERVTDAFVALDCNWCYTYVNEKAGQIFGRRPADLVGKHIWTEFPEGVGQPFHLAYERAMTEQQPLQVELYYPPYERWFENRVYPSPDGLTIYFQDITERKKTRDALRRERDLFERVAETSPAGIVEVDRTGMITYANAQAERVLCLTRIESAGRAYCAPAWHVTDYDGGAFPDEELPYRRVMATGAAVLDVRHAVEWPDGRRVLLVVSAAPMRNASGDVDGIVATVTDVTRDVEVERTLRESEEKLRLFVEHAPAAIAMFDFGMRYLAASRRWLEDYGLGSQGLSGRSHYDVFPELPERWKAVHRRCLAGAVERCEEDPFPRADGAVDWVRWAVHPWHDRTGAVGGLVIFSEVITKRKLAEQQIQEQLRMLQTLNSGARRLAESVDPAAIVEQVARQCVDELGAGLAWVGRAQPDGRVTLLSHHPPEIRYPREIVVRWDETAAGMGPSGRAIRTDLPQVLADIASSTAYAPWRAAALAEGFCTSAAFPMTSRERPFGVLNLYAEKPDFFSPERVELFRSFAHQAAAALENARLLAELQQQAALLEQRVTQRTAELAETNAELDAFAYSVSHDLRAPLRAMQGLSQALVEDYGSRLDETGHDYARRIVAAAERMDTLIQDLLAYGRLSRAEIRLVPVRLGAAIGDVLAQMSEDLRARGAAVLVSVDLMYVLAQRPTLDQALTNLISNAVKFVSPGVTPRVTLRAEKVCDRVRLWVEDNGIGIAPEHLARVFRVFERLHGVESYPGTGIGLAIVRKGVERMGGTAGVESEAGEGSRFWVELTAAQGVP